MALARFIPVLILLSAAYAEQYAPAGVVRGRIAAPPEAKSREVRVRDSADEILVCTFDSGTYIERYGERIAPDGLRQGDPVEIVAEHRTSAPCYALMIRVAEQRPVIIPSTGFRSRTRTPPRPALETWVPRGNLTYAGVVLRANPEVLIIRTRDGEERTLVLRDDTRYMDSGTLSDRAALRPNTRVFIRAGRNIDQEIEAYQVVWGRIAGP